MIPDEAVERDGLALELFIADNSNQSRERSIEDWKWLNEHGHMRDRIEHYFLMATTVLKLGYSRKHEAR